MGVCVGFAARAIDAGEYKEITFFDGLISRPVAAGINFQNGRELLGVAY